MFQRISRAKRDGGGSAASHTEQNVRVQRKLAIGAINDPLEDEADATADKIMRMEEPAFASRGSGNSPQSVQRKCEECEEEEKVKRKPAGESATPFIQANGAEGGAANAELVGRIDASKGGGSGMDGRTKDFMESRFGTDFSEVRIHSGDYAAQMSKELNAQAFTVGNDIYFNSGKYSPDSMTGRHLLAHELTHTLQQSEGIASRKSIQRLTASATGTPHDGRCGGFTRSFNFTLDNPAPTDGYMIQKVDRYDNEVKCPGMGACPANPSLTFFEAFFVRSGSTEFYRRSALGKTDQAGHEAKPGTSGARYAHGEIRFFPIAVTGNLGRNNTAGIWKPGNAGGVTPSQSLPSTLTSPTWWDQHTEGPVRRYVDADWRCCSDSSDFNKVVSDPT